ncbi:MAG: alpha/beta hydrolase [Acidimicrobiia bacterium]
MVPLLAAWSDGGADDDSTAAPAGPDPQLTDRACEVSPDLGVAVTCHWLIVPEDRDQPSDGEIRLAVVLLRSRSTDARPDPVVFLAGGPGDSGTDGLEGWAESRLLDNRDLVLLDQRGTGVSQPVLECPEREEAVVRNLGRDEGYEEELGDYRRAIGQCWRRLVRDGVDLDAYDTEASAADVADLRVALGVDEWNLYGVSYGTRLALATMRSHPEGIRSVVLDSVYPTTVGGLARLGAAADRSFAALFDGCDADPACSEAYPDLEATFGSVVDRFNETPFEGTVDLGEPFGVVPLAITGDDIVAGLFDALYDTDLIPLLPSIGADLQEGETGAIPAIAQQGIPFLNDAAEGTYLSVDCADSGRLGARRNRELLDRPGDKAGLFVYASDAFCADWDVEPLPRAFNRPVRSRIPALVIAGTYDPVTPPGDSKAAARALKNATYVEFDGWGHAVTDTDEDCPLAIRQAFLDDPAAVLDTSCAGAFEPSFDV